MEIEVRSYRPCDEVQIIKLFKETYNRDLDLNYWKWRFAENPFDNPKILMAFDGAKLVGHYAISPVRALLSGTESLIAHSMTTMTHPDYQGQGFFTKLASELYEQLMGLDYQGVWGFPNNNSYYGFVKRLGWKPILEIPFLHCEEPFNNVPSVQADFGFESIQLTNAISSSSSSSSTQILRSQKYLHWRYKENPSNEYHFVSLKMNEQYLGYLVYKIYQTEESSSVDLLETQANDAHSLSLMLEWARYYFIGEKKIKRLNAWCNIHTEEYLCFLKNQFKAGKNTYMAGLNLLINKGPQDWLDPRGWRVSMGDSDVF